MPWCSNLLRLRFFLNLFIWPVGSKDYCIFVWGTGLRLFRAWSDLRWGFEINLLLPIKFRLLMSNVIGLYRSWGDVSSPKVISSLKWCELSLWDNLLLRTYWVSTLMLIMLLSNLIGYTGLGVTCRWGGVVGYRF